jgi:hypothetical protein
MIYHAPNNPIPIAHSSPRSIGILLWLLLFIGWTAPLHAQTLPPCAERDWRWIPRVQPEWLCLEHVLTDASAGEMGFTALAVAPAGTLYAARPLQGEIWRITDANGDGLPETAAIVVDGLTLPNALVYHADALYIAGGARIDRLNADDTLTALVDDLPSGAGFWTGGLAIGGGRLYVGIGAPCEFCEWDEAERGAVLSFALDGTDRQLEAQGFRLPLALWWTDAGLWVADSAPNALLAVPALDELNRVTARGQHFGFPYCSGRENQPNLTFAAANFDCTQAIPPIMLLESQSYAVSLQPYQGAAFPPLADKWLLLLSGSRWRTDMRGYALAAFDPEALLMLPIDDSLPVTYLFPYDASITAAGDYLYQAHSGLVNESSRRINQRGAGVYPHRLYGMAQSPEGWIYFSVGGGTIYALRPR